MGIGPGEQPRIAAQMLFQQIDPAAMDRRRRGVR
jgi:hypothetical protein